MMTLEEKIRKARAAGMPEELIQQKVREEQTQLRRQQAQVEREEAPISARIPLLGMLTRPVEKYGRAVGAGAEGALRFLTDPAFRRAATGGELTPEEAQRIAAIKPRTLTTSGELERLDPKEMLKRTAGMEAMLIPGGKTVGGMAGLGALTGGLYGFSEDQGILPSMAGGAAGGVIAGKVIPAVTSKVGAYLRKKFPQIGKSLALRTLRPSPSQQVAFERKAKQPIEDFIVSNKLFKRGVDEVDNLITPLQQSFDDIAKNSGRKVQPTSLLQKFADKVDELLQSVASEDIAKAQKIDDTAMRFIGKYGDEVMDVAKLTAERRRFDKLVTPSHWAKDPTIAGANRTIRDILQETIQEATEDITDPSGKTLKQIGQQLSELYSFRDIAQKQSKLGKGTLPLGLTRLLGGGILGTLGFSIDRDPEGAAKGILLGMGLVSLANNPKVLASVASALIKVGKEKGVEKATPGLMGTLTGKITEQAPGLLERLGRVGGARMAGTPGREPMPAIEGLPTGAGVPTPTTEAPTQPRKSLLETLTPEVMFALLTKLPKEQAAQLEKAYKYLEKAEPTAKVAEAQKEAQGKVKDIDKAIGLLEDVGIKTGPVSGRALATQAKTVGVSADERTAYRLISKIATMEMFKIGGKVLPAQEINRLKPFLPDINMPTEQNIDNLKALKTELEAVYQQVSRGEIELVDMTDEEIEALL